ncbi:unnamed protein product [Meganyctiphanes norvegica]|uniref:Gustatory receptor n=1 Tax=Meganyctiphanes norvegica TaxID=48144 RepID=A0AAV2RDB5_MEGNR
MYPNMEIVIISNLARSAVFTGLLWTFFLQITDKLHGLRERHGHRISSTFSLVVYTVDVSLDIYTVYTQYQTFDEKIRNILTCIGVTFIFISAFVSSSITYYIMRIRWSNEPLTFKWYHYLIYTGVGFFLLPLCVLAADAKRAWCLDRKQFEDKQKAELKYVIITESLIEGVLQFLMQVHIVIKVQPMFTLAWYRWVSMFTSLLSAARGASLLLQMNGLCKTYPKMGIVYLMFAICLRSVVFALHGNLFGDICKFFDRIDINQTFGSYTSMYLITTITASIVILKKEFPSNGSAHKLWSAFRAFLGHFLLDIVTHYGLLYSLLFVASSIVVNVKRPEEEWKRSFPKYCTEELSQKCNDRQYKHNYYEGLVNGYVIISVNCLLINLISVIMAITKFTFIGKYFRKIWDVFNTNNSIDFADVVGI